MDGASAVIGLAAGIVQLIETTVKVVDYVDDVENAATERKRFLAELQALTPLLHSLKDAAREPEARRTQHTWGLLSAADGPLKIFKSSLEECVELVSVDQTLITWTKKLLWSRTRKKVDKCLALTERLKSIILICLAQRNSSDIGNISAGMKQLETDAAWLRTHAVTADVLEGSSQVIRADIAQLRDYLVDQSSVGYEQISSRLKTDRSEIDERVAQMSSEQKAALSKAQETLEAKTILDWAQQLTSNFHAAQYKFLIDAWVDGTTSWFLEAPYFESFCTTPQSTLLCTGIPGSGKSTVAAVAIKAVRHRFDTTDVSASKSALVMLFCNYARREKQSPTALLAAMLSQMVAGLSSPPESVKRLYANNPRASSSAAIPCRELQDAILGLLSTWETTYVVVDALDECYTHDRNALLDLLFEMQSQLDVRLLVTSRDIGEVIRRFGHGTFRAVVRADETDLRAYIDHRLKSFGPIFQQNPELAAVAKASIIDAADGMFILARLHADSVRSKLTVREVKSVLESLRTSPKTLDAAYQSALQRIDEHQSMERRDLAHKAISWVFYTKRPLRWTELQEALSIEPGDTRLDPDGFVDRDTVIDSCAGLLTLSNSENSAVQLVHYTTRQYLEHQIRQWLPGCQAQIATLCLTYLRFDDFKEGVKAPDRLWGYFRTRYKLFEYLTVTWLSHYLEGATASNQDLLFDLLSYGTLCTMYSQIFVQRWHMHSGHPVERTDDVEMHHGGQRPAEARPEDSISAVHFATLHGMDWLIKRLIRKGFDSNLRDQDGRTPLSYAAAAGDVAKVQTLVKHANSASDLNSRDNWGSTPLHRATRLGATDVVQVLLAQTGIEPDLKDHYGRTPLSYAAERGNVAILQALLSQGHPRVQLNSHDKYRLTPYGRSLLARATEATKILHRQGDTEELNPGPDPNDQYQDDSLRYHSEDQWALREAAKLASDSAFADGHHVAGDFDTDDVHYDESYDKDMAQDEAREDHQRYFNIMATLHARPIGKIDLSLADNQRSSTPVNENFRRTTLEGADTFPWDVLHSESRFPPPPRPWDSPRVKLWNPFDPKESPQSEPEMLSKPDASQRFIPCEVCSQELCPNSWPPDPISERKRNEALVHRSQPPPHTLPLTYPALGHSWETLGPNWVPRRHSMPALLYSEADVPGARILGPYGLVIESAAQDLLNFPPVRRNSWPGNMAERFLLHDYLDFLESIRRDKIQVCGFGILAPPAHWRIAAYMHIDLVEDLSVENLHRNPFLNSFKRFGTPLILSKDKRSDDMVRRFPPLSDDDHDSFDTLPLQQTIDSASEPHSLDADSLYVEDGDTDSVFSRRPIPALGTERRDMLIARLERQNGPYVRRWASAPDVLSLIGVTKEP